ncbi:hypothetical protein Ddye_014813, partial [Dipteronia dyeriana]
MEEDMLLLVVYNCAQSIDQKVMQGVWWTRMSMADKLPGTTIPRSSVPRNSPTIYASTSKSEFRLVILLNFAFMEGKFNGREMPIVGGSGIFRYSRGYAQVKTQTFDVKGGIAVLEYNINFHNSSLVKIGKKPTSGDKWAIAFRYKLSSLPMSYLCLPLSGNSLRESLWLPVIKKIEDRLAPWRRSLLSKWGRLVLIKAVLSSFPTYNMSVFDITVGVAKRIENLQRDFFWNDGVLKKKVHGVDWVSLCKSKRFGGLGIGRIKDKGVSLMAKWIWRFGNEHSSLWKMILCAKYGVYNEGIMWDLFQVKSCSTFVKSVNKLFVSSSVTTSIIKKGFKAVVGSGERVNFWKDLGWDSSPLMHTFPRIFALATCKDGLVSEYGNWVNNSWSWNIQLRRQPFDWELSQWNRFIMALKNIPIRRGIADAWLGLFVQMVASQLALFGDVWRKWE